MQDTSTLYRQLLADENHYVETRLVVGKDGRLVTSSGDAITFGGVSILVETGAPDGGYDEGTLMSVSTSGALFSGSTPEVGCAISREIDVEMLKPAADFPRQARMASFVRLSDGGNVSEWLPKGVFYIDTREHVPGDVEKLTIHGYDAMMRAEQDYANTSLSWPAKDTDIVDEIAAAIGVSVDSRTYGIMTKSYRLDYRTGYTMREYLAGIAAMYAGSFIMNDLGQLRLVVLNGYPAETNLLCDHAGYTLTFGGERIRV